MQYDRGVGDIGRLLPDVLSAGECTFSKAVIVLVPEFIMYHESEARRKVDFQNALAHACCGTVARRSRIEVCVTLVGPLF